MSVTIIIFLIKVHNRMIALDRVFLKYILIYTKVILKIL